MKTTSILLSLIAASALSFGCNKKSDDKKAEDPTAAADAAPAAGKEIPTEQDFEEKAATEVTKDNVEAEVEKMEKELATEGSAAGGGEAAPPAGGEPAPKK